jgi:hypothetical protein
VSFGPERVIGTTEASLSAGPIPEPGPKKTSMRLAGERRLTIDKQFSVRRDAPLLSSPPRLLASAPCGTFAGCLAQSTSRPPPRPSMRIRHCYWHNPC